MLTALRNGDWATRERIDAYPRILLTISFIAIVSFLAMSHGEIAPNDLPIGSDFSQVWVAGREALAGHPDAPFDLARHAIAQRDAFGLEDSVFGWHYPPYFLLPAALLAHLPYLQALALWQSATLALYLFSVVPLLSASRMGRGRVIVAALAFPAVLVNLGHGQNGFLTAALLGGGFALLDKRPLLAGALFALLAYKPQFAALLPLALLMGRRWRALMGSATTLAFMTLASILAFGVESWRAFFANLGFTRAIVVEQGATGFEKIQSVFAAVRLMGGDVPTAWLCQGLAGLCVLAGLVALLRSQADQRVKAAGTIAAMFLSTPYALDYDMMALAPALALLLDHALENGFGPYEKSALAFVYVAPLLARIVASLLPAPLGVLSVAALFLAILRQGFTKGDKGARRLCSSADEGSERWNAVPINPVLEKS